MLSVDHFAEVAMRRLSLAVSALLLAACTDNPIAPKQALRVDPSGGHKQVTTVVWEKSSTGVDILPIGQFNGQYTVLVDINDNGLAVGLANTPDGGQRAISWQNGVFTDLGTLGGNYSVAHQVNSAGVIVGEAEDASGRVLPVVWENGVIRALPQLGTDNPFAGGGAQSINERGDIVGFVYDDVTAITAALWPAAGGVVNLGKLPGADISYAKAINRAGTIFGMSDFYISPEVGYSERVNIWTGGAPSEVALPPGGMATGDATEGRVFNDAGNFLAMLPGEIPYYFGRSIVFRNGAFETLAMLPGAQFQINQALGLNEAGDVVGMAFGPFNFLPVLWSHDGTMTNLGQPGTMSGGDAHGINNRGLIVGQTIGEWTPGIVGGGAVIWRVSAPDVTPPTIAYSAHATNYTVDAHVSITCSASDAESGLASNTCAPIEGDAYVFGLGAHTYSATATDNAGNSASASTTFTVSVTFASLTNLTRRFVTSSGVADDLARDLSDAQKARAAGKTKQADAALQDYRDTLKAQTGKSVTAERAAILIGLSQAV